MLFAPPSCFSEWIRPGMRECTACKDPYSEHDQHNKGYQYCVEKLDGFGFFEISETINLWVSQSCWSNLSIDVLALLTSLRLGVAHTLHAGCEFDQNEQQYWLTNLQKCWKVSKTYASHGATVSLQVKWTQGQGVLPSILCTQTRPWCSCQVTGRWT